MRLPSEIEREERERVATKRPALAMPRWIPRIVPKAQPDPFVWRDVADFMPVELEP
jgi:hypothetical protein